MTAAGDARQVTHLTEVAYALCVEFDADHRAWLDGAAEPDWLTWAKRLSTVLGKVTAEPTGEVVTLLASALDDAIAYRHLFPASEPGRVAGYEALAAAIAAEEQQREEVAR